MSAGIIKQSAVDFLSLIDQQDRDILADGVFNSACGTDKPGTIGYRIQSPPALRTDENIQQIE
jgi:hypothetical protein